MVVCGLMFGAILMSCSLASGPSPDSPPQRLTSREARSSSVGMHEIRPLSRSGLSKAGPLLAVTEDTTFWGVP